jgi:outer membrane protein assembly factor BamB
MHRSRRAVLAAVGGTLFAGTATGTNWARADRLGNARVDDSAERTRHDDPEERAPDVAWTFDPHETLGRPAAAEDTVVVSGSGPTSTAGRLYALSADGGELRWRTDRIEAIGRRPSLVGDLAILPTGDGLRAYGRKDGEERWRVDLGGRPARVFSLHDSVVVGISGQTYAFDRQGTERWRSGAGDRPVTDGELVVTTDGDSLTALDGEDGERTWSVEVPMGVTDTPVVGDGTAFVIDEAGTLAAYSDGDLDWTVEGERPSRPAIDDENVYVATRNGGLAAHDREDGEVKWRRPDERVTDLVVSEGELTTVRVPHERPGEPTPLLEARSVETGTPHWERDLSGERTPVVSAETLYLGGGDLRALR